MRAALVVIAMLAAPAVARAQVVSEGAEAVSIVVYPGGDPRTPGRDLGEGLVMVTETRTIDLPAGPSRVSFRGVAEGIVAQTVAVEGLPGGVKEQNFDYQLLSPGSLLANSDGRNVTLVRTNRATGKVVQERARVVSSKSGVLLDIDGRIEALRCSALPEKLVFDDLPAGYSDKPTLSVEVVSPRAERATVLLSYLATGVSWAADYVARIAPDGRTLDLSSWITIGNRSATTFADAPVQVLAGRLERTEGETQPVTPPRVSFYPNCWEINSGRAGSPIAYQVPPPPPAPAPMMARADAEHAFEEIVVTASRRTEVEDLGDYKLYSLPEPTTLAAYQTKLLQMFERTGVPFARVYRVALETTDDHAAWEDDGGAVVPTSIIAELENKADRGLGLALPAGKVSIFEPGAPGRVRFVGEDEVRDIAVGLPVEFDLGESSAVQAQKRIVNYSATGRSVAAKVEVTLTNASAAPADIQVREAGGAPKLRVAGESHRHGLKYGAPQWQVRVPANKSTVLTYTLKWQED